MSRSAPSDADEWSCGGTRGEGVIVDGRVLADEHVLLWGDA
jgi:hypothetical protein